MKMSFTITSKYTKRLQINVTKDERLVQLKVQNRREKLKVQIDEELRLGRGLEDSVLVRCCFFPNRSTDKCHLNQNPSRIFKNCNR